MDCIRGLQKDLILLKYARTQELRTLPLAAQIFLHTTLRYEKLTVHDGRYIISTFFPPLPSRAYAEMVKSTVAVYQKKPYPYSAYCALTHRCRFACWHCSKDLRSGPELSTQDWQEVMRALQAHGVSLIGFTGGEPLLRDDLEEILKAIDERSAKILFTTGDGLSCERCRSLKSCGLDYVAISLDSYEEAEHNRLRGREDAFRVALESIRNSLEEGFYTAVQTVPRREMLARKYMTRFVDFVRGLGAHEIRFVEPMPTGRLLNDNAHVLFSQEDRAKLRQYHITINQSKTHPKVASFAYVEDKTLYGCGAGIQHLYIDASGNLCPCDFTPLSFGHVAQGGFEAAYQEIRSCFRHPYDCCFIQKNHQLVKDRYRGNLPLSCEDSRAVCREAPRTSLPRFYQKLGWKAPKKLSVFLTKVAVSLAVVLATTFGWLPTRSVRLAPNSERQDLSRYLETIAQKLSVDIGIRDIGHYQQLEAAKDYIAQEFEALGYEVSFQTYSLDGQSFSNVIARKRQALAGEMLVVGAHYDTRSNPGADDNASGIAGVLALAKLLSADAAADKIIFAAFVNEEPPFFQTGSMGSRVFTRDLKERGFKIKGAVILEMIGHYSQEWFSQRYLPLLGPFFPNKGNFIAVIGKPDSFALAQRLGSGFRRATVFPLRTIIFPAAFPVIDFSDHWSFWQEGYPAVMVTDTAYLRNKNYHKTTDLPGTLRYDEMAEVVRGLREAIRQSLRD